MGEIFRSGGIPGLFVSYVSEPPHIPHPPPLLFPLLLSFPLISLPPYLTLSHPSAGRRTYLR
jgi:hypothetical protein